MGYVGAMKMKMIWTCEALKDCGCNGDTVSTKLATMAPSPARAETSSCTCLLVTS